MQKQTKSNKNDTFRAFFAINPPQEVQESLVKITEPLRKDKSLKNIRWTKTENLHITLRFLGNITQLQFQEITAKVEQELNMFPTLNISLTELLWFPKDKPRMIIVRPEPLVELLKLEMLLDKQVITCGIPEESRPYIPHITLCRMKKSKGHSPLKRTELSLLPKIVSDINFTANEVFLFRSDPDPISHTSKYTPIKHFALQNNKKT